MPRVAVGLSLRALARGRISPTRLDIIDASIALVRDEDGGVAVESDQISKERFEQILDLLIRPPGGPSSFANLRYLAIRNGQLEFDDREKEMRWHIPVLDVEIVRDATTISGFLGGEIEIADQQWAIMAEGAFHYGTKASEITVSLDEFVPSMLARQYPQIPVASTFNVPLSGVLKIALGPSGVLKSIVADLSAGRGEIVQPQYLRQPLSIDDLTIEGEYSEQDGRLDIRNFEIRSEGMYAGIDGLIDLSTEDTRILASADIRGLNAEFLKSHWPREIGENAHQWIERNVSRGVFPNSTLAVDLRRSEFNRDIPPDAIEYRFSFEDLTARYMRQMPPLTGARGYGRLTPHELTLQVEHARSDEIPALSGALRFYNLHLKGERMAEIEVHADNDIRQILTLIDHQPLGYVSKFGKKPDDVRGRANIRADFDFPMLQDLKLKDVTIGVTGDLKDVELPGIIGFARTDDGELHLELTKERLGLTGSMRFNGVPLAVEWREVLDGSAEHSSRYFVTGRLDDTQRKALELPGETLLHGMTDVELTLIGRGDEFADGEFIVSLDDAAIDVPTLGWHKAKGVDGEIRGNVRSEGDDLFFDGIVVQTPTGSLRGEFTLTPQGRLSDLNIQDLRVGETRLAVTGRQDDNAFQLTVNSPVLDMRPAISTLFDESTEDQGFINANVLLEIDRAIAENGIEFRDLIGTARHVEGWWENVNVRSRIGQESLIEIHINRNGLVREMSMLAENAGDLARGLGFYRNAHGGTLRLEGIIDDTLAGEPIIGELTVKNFRIRNAPTLAQILSIGSLTGIGDTLSGDGIAFRELGIPFVLEAGMIKVNNGRARGSSLGVTLTGWRDDVDDTLNFTGTVIPAYTLNSLLGNIPLVGAILRGGQGDGVFAFTYAVSGSRDDPRISVNPLAALAPGLIRNLASPGSNLSEVEVSEVDRLRARMLPPVN